MTQDEAFAILKTGLNVFLTGEPGSGKTHTINRYIAWLAERGVEVAVTASTGIAATHVAGMTIHSWSGIGIKRDISDYEIEIIASREKTARRLIDAKILIIDEISMLDATTLASVDRVLRTLRRGVLAAEQPFGGLQIIFVGDFFQLPPINKDNRSAGPGFAFESEAWKMANPIACYLNEQHRQDDPDFLETLTAMRHGKFTDTDRARLASRLNVKPKDAVATRLYTHNANVDRINDEALGRISGSMHVYTMSSRGSKTLVEALKHNCLSPETLNLKEGAAVMFTRNNFEAGYVNGTLGDVIGFTSLGQPIVKTRANGTLTVEPAKWEVMDGNKILAEINQVPLRLAWAITVHKSQGMSLDAAIIDLSQAFEYGQGYVAISRVRTLGGLFLEGFNERALELHPAVVAQDRYFRAYSDAARKKFADLATDEKVKLEKNFLRAIGAKDPSPVKKEELKKGSLETLREKFPNAGRPWNKDDDVLITKMFQDNISPKDMGSRFGRKPSAVTARLGHLGLIPDQWAWKKKESR